MLDHVAGDDEVERFACDLAEGVAITDDVWLNDLFCRHVWISTCELLTSALIRVRHARSRRNRERIMQRADLKACSTYQFEPRSPKILLASTPQADWSM